MKLLPCYWKRLIPVVILILHPSLAFSDLPPSGDLILSDVEIVQVVLGPKGVDRRKACCSQIDNHSTFTDSETYRGPCRL